MDLDGQMDKLFTKMGSRTKLGEALLFDGVQATEARRDASLVERIAFQMEQAALAAEEAGRKTAFYNDSLRSLEAMRRMLKVTELDWLASLLRLTLPLDKAKQAQR